MNDETRAKSPFLVVSLEFDENGPNDVISDWRLSIIVKCLRLTENYELLTNAEFVTFSKREPMSVAQPPDNEIELMGYARMPIGLQHE